LISPQAWMPEALPLSISRLMCEADWTPQPGGASTKRGDLRNAAYAYAADPGRATASCRRWAVGAWLWSDPHAIKPSNVPSRTAQSARPRGHPS